jgi:hypothetical protein
MNRRLRILYLAMLALFVASGLTASTATAGTLSADSYPATLTAYGANDGVFFDFTEGEFVNYACKMHLSSETLQASSSTFVMHPVFTNCHLQHWETTVTTTGCDFRFHIGETTGESGNYAGTVDLVCEAGTSLKFSPIVGCQVEVHPQEELGSVEFINMAGSPSDFTIAWNVEGFQYTVIKDGFGCPYSGLGTKEDGDFTVFPQTTVEKTNGLNGVKIEM